MKRRLAGLLGLLLLCIPCGLGADGAAPRARVKACTGEEIGYWKMLQRPEDGKTALLLMQDPDTNAVDDVICFVPVDMLVRAVQEL